MSDDLTTGTNGAGSPIGFFHVVPDDSWDESDEEYMNEPEVRTLLQDIHVRVVRLDTQREGDTAAVADLKKRLETLEGRLWGAYGGIALALLGAVLGFVL